jgi:hypothetical protein
MELLNATPMRAAYTVGLDPDGRERAVVVVKGTFTLPDGAGAARLAEEQLEPVVADVHGGEPGLSSVVHESDFAPVKPRCDVLVNGVAHAPGGRPAEAVRVGLSVAGRFDKVINVFGDRVWQRSITGSVPGDPRPFLTMPVTYEQAYGGVDTDPERPERVQSFAANPIGKGFYPYTDRKHLEGKPLPNTAEPGRPVTARTGSYAPLALGALGRNFATRLAFAGTYDEAWLEEHFPFLPPNFDVRYYQAAPLDQQIDHPTADERFVLTNLTPSGHLEFILPHLEIPVEWSTTGHEHEAVVAALDTIVVEPEARRVLCTWRASRALRKNIFELARVVIGRMPPGYYRARLLGKEYLSLASLRSPVVEEEDEDEDEDEESEASG